MSIAALPNELFDLIIYDLVESERVTTAAKYRLVCKAFSTNVQKAIIDKASRSSLPIFVQDAKQASLFQIAGDTILYKKVYQNPPDDFHIVKFIKKIVHFLIQSKRLRYEPFRKQLTASICHAMMGIKPHALRCQITTPRSILVTDEILPGVYAAIGDYRMLQKSVSQCKVLFDEPCGLFPNAFHAAVAADRTKILRGQLNYITNAIRGSRENEKYPLMQAAIRNIIKGLKIAVRLRRSAAGNMLFDALDGPKSLRETTSSMKAITFGKTDYSRLGENLYRDCVKQNCIDLVYRSLQLIQPVHPIEPTIGPPNCYGIRDHRMGFLIRYGSLRMWAKLLEDGQIDPDRNHNRRTLVHNALQCRRRDVAQVLLDYGADVNAFDSARGVTALYCVAEGGFYWDVLFLLKNGADPKYPYDDLTKSPLQVAEKMGFSKTRFLLRLALSKMHNAKPITWNAEVLEMYEWHKDHGISFRF